MDGGQNKIRAYVKCINIRVALSFAIKAFNSIKTVVSDISDTVYTILGISDNQICRILQNNAFK